jgi:Homeodomain-like domain
MGKPYSEDLRVRVLRAGQAGGTIPEIAEQLGVSISSAHPRDGGQSHRLRGGAGARGRHA